MIWLRLVPVYIAIALLMAHYLRSGDYGALTFWVAVPFLLVLRRRWATRLVQLFLLIGSAIWVEALYSIVQIRLADNRPWLRLVIILGSVSAVTAGSAFIFQAKSLRDRFLDGVKNTNAGLAAFLLTFFLLAIAHYIVKTPILLLERFLPGFGPVEILLLAIYAGWITDDIRGPVKGEPGTGHW